MQHACNTGKCDDCCWLCNGSITLCCCQMRALISSTVVVRQKREAAAKQSVTNNRRTVRLYKMAVKLELHPLCRSPSWRHFAGVSRLLAISAAVSRSPSWMARSNLRGVHGGSSRKVKRWPRRPQPSTTRTRDAAAASPATASTHGAIASGTQHTTSPPSVISPAHHLHPPRPPPTITQPTYNRDQWAPPSLRTGLRPPPPPHQPTTCSHPAHL